MFGHGAGRLKILAFTLALAGVAATGLVAEGKGVRSKTIRIGLVGTLFRDIPQPMVLAASQPFRALMEAQTGFTGELVPAGDAEDLGERLASDKVDLGVFHGVEFGWARQKYPDLRPLVIAVNYQRHLRAHLVTKKDSPATCLADLKGKPLALPYRSREHCRMFLEHRCAGGEDPQQFFSRITTPANAEAAIEEVLGGVVSAAVVDDMALNCYKQRKPGRYHRLRDLQKSETFPAAVVAYRAGALDEATLQRFRDGLVSANQNDRGRQILTMWRLTGFERIPDDYERTLGNIVRAYPAPGAAVPKAVVKTPAAAAE